MADNSDLLQLTRAVVELHENEVYTRLDSLLSKNVTPHEIIDALSAGMEEVGNLYKNGEYFLSELVFSGEIFKTAMNKIKPLLHSEGGRASKGKVLMGTVKGDIHDLGKNIVITLLECSGFEVTDLGVDVPVEKFVQSAKDTGIQLIGLSALLTTAFDSMRDTVDAFSVSGLRDKVKIMIGGGSTSEKLKEQIGADFYGRDATEAVDIAKNLFNAG